MRQKFEKILMTSSAMSLALAVGILSTPYIMDYIDDTYQEIQIQEKREEIAKRIRGYSVGSTAASQAMMKDKRDLIVNITSDGSSGSGVHLTEHIILTARHVAEGLNTDSLVKTTYGGKIRIENPEGYLHHEDLDISLIILPGMKPAEKRLLTLREGIDEEKVFRIGFTGGMNMNSSEGRYEADLLPIEKVNKIEGKISGLDTFFVPGGAGDSGSVIWAADGSVVGMVNAGPSIEDGLRNEFIESGIYGIDPKETSIEQDKLRVLLQKNYLMGYSRMLPKAVDHLYNKIQLTGYTKVEPPKPMNIKGIRKKRA